MKTETQYDQQATEFLSRNGMKLRITLSNSKPASWEPSGNHYRVTISRTFDHFDQSTGKQWPTRLPFDFWGSVNDAKKGLEPSAYYVLSCISSDAHMDYTGFEEWCDNYGYERDSIKALQTFRRCDRFARRLREFFTAAELEQLSEIQ